MNNDTPEMAPQVQPEATDRPATQTQPPEHPALPIDQAEPDPATCPEDSAAPAQRGKIQIGSRRDLSAPSSSRPQAAGQDKPIQIPMPPPAPTEPVPPPAPTGPVPPPSIRQPLSDDLEAQFNAAMGNASLDDILAGGVNAATAAPVELESHHRTPVTRIHGDNVFFSLGGRDEGVASLRQFPEPPQLGAEYEVIVKSFSADDGLYELIIPGASAHVEDWSDLVEGSVVEARITGANTGGLECKVGSLRGFIPSSQIAIFRVEDYAEFLEQKLLCVVTEVNPKRKNLVLSRRAILEREKEEARREVLQSLEVGQIIDGVVRKIREFGAFVDIGGVDGLLHVSQLSWDRVNHPSEVLQEGQKVRVKVEKVDSQTGKISLSYRDLQEHPWDSIQEKFPVESIIKGKVSRIAKFGAFVKLAPGIEGLVHISELSYSRVPTVSSVVSEGQDVEVKVLSIDTDAQRIALSMKAVLPEPASEPEVEEAVQPDERFEAQREAVAARRSKPLKGGTSRASGGEQFGLKW